ncbi:cytochrome d ubiquinol oxidase subunit II [Trueperella bialowiezensis]|uniref:Cytochrome d ubiquinol oxidase subunit 2 n=1 Tax=Trueperella bialowiezensis TaxID=312285 RepID=A0A3S4VBT7_9ACTO|nr:cytochrome d ubiquinol oxidase subunit II [Trueperella bialowiezensis]VEI14043.1 Cytochrome d ubiquinol oxidase subunit 2 [Trueperella bialowiezensis]
MELTALQIIWFVLIAVLWIGYLTLEGFGFGVGMLLKILPRNEKERRLALNTIGPHWDGNEVFLLTAGGATFAAFPEWYATMFSGMYMALVAILLFLIVRIVAIEWRGKINSHGWRTTWDWLHTGVAWLVTLVWGVAFGNLVQGTQIRIGHYEQYGGGQFIEADRANIDAALAAGDQHFLTGGFVSLFTPFTIVAGLVFLALFLTHGALWLAIKTKGEFQERAIELAKKLSIGSTGLTAVWGIWGQLAYSDNGFGWIPLLLAAALLIGSTLMAQQAKDLPAFLMSFGGLALAVTWVFTTFWPNAMKSTVSDAYHLTLAQASATAPTQAVMLIAAVIFVPIVFGYMGWSYKQFAARIGTENISDEPAGLHPDKIRQFETA